MEEGTPSRQHLLAVAEKQDDVPPNDPWKPNLVCVIYASPAKSLPQSIHERLERAASERQ